jgi:hypothetical protein
VLTEATAKVLQLVDSDVAETRLVQESLFPMDKSHKDIAKVDKDSNLFEEFRKMASNAIVEPLEEAHIDSKSGQYYINTEELY